jgi:hypothetical protein
MARLPLRYRSAPRIERVCRLIKAVGESVEYREGDPLPTRPSHRVGPELVVQVGGEAGGGGGLQHTGAGPSCCVCVY